jgi:type I restriction enzyme S subunit
MTERSPWPTVRLGEVVACRKDSVTIEDLATYKRPRVQLHAQGIVLRDEILGAAIKTKKQQVCHTGDFLVAEIDAKVGGFGIVPESLDGSIVSSHYFLYAIDETKLHRSFLDYFIRTPAFREQVEAQGSTNYAAIRPSDVLGYEIPVPPLAVQRRIVARIEELAALIDEARTLRKEASDPTDSLLDGCATRLLGAEGSPKWPTGELESLCSVFIDCDHRTPDYLDEGVPLLRPRDIRPGVLLTAGTARIAREEHELRCRRHLPVAGDIVYSRELSLGNAAMVPEGCEVSLGQGTMLMRADSTSVSNDYLSRVLNSPVIRQQALRAAKGAAHPHLNIRDIRAFRVPVPPLPEQRRIVAHLDELQTQVGALKDLQADTAAELDATLPSILGRAFKGGL